MEEFLLHVACVILQLLDWKTNNNNDCSNHDYNIMNYLETGF